MIREILEDLAELTESWSTGHDAGARAGRRMKGYARHWGSPVSKKLYKKHHQDLRQRMRGRDTGGKVKSGGAKHAEVTRQTVHKLTRGSKSKGRQPTGMTSGYARLQDKLAARRAAKRG